MDGVTNTTFYIILSPVEASGLLDPTWNCALTVYSNYAIEKHIQNMFMYYCYKQLQTYD